jgi:hypothetical protein
VLIEKAEDVGDHGPDAAKAARPDDLGGLAAGAEPSKMKYGRGQNQPCLGVGTQRCFIK